VRLRVVFVMGIISVLVPTGCAGPFYRPPRQQAERAPAQYYPPSPPPKSAGIPKPAPVQSSPLAPPVAPAPEADVAVVGLSGAAVRSLFGAPATRAASGPGETWGYHSGECQVQLYLFPDVAHGGLRVLDYHVATGSSRGDDPQPCLRRLRHGHGS
jgi:hypothetical protein